MAKRTRMTAPRPSVRDSEQGKFLQKGLDELVNTVTADNPVFEVVGTPTQTVKLPDGQWRKKPLDAGMELTMNGAYMGASGPILTFTPFDAREYEQVEFKPDELDRIVPGFLRWTLGKTGQEVASTAGMISKLAQTIETLESAAKAETAAAVQADAAEIYKNHPLFGKFA